MSKKPNNSNTAVKTKKAAKIRQMLINFCKGAVIGVGAILPGISGGVLCVVFGIYGPMMRFLSTPIQAFKAYYRLLLPVLAGWAIGFIGLARVVEILFRTSQAPAIWLFIGLIAGTLPSLYSSAGKNGRTGGSWIGFWTCFIIFLAYLFFLSFNNVVQIDGSVFWWVVCGVLWGIGLIVPGLSPSSFLIYLGLYQPMTAGIANLSLEVIIPMAIGMALSVLLLARLVNMLFQRYYSITSHALLGVILASTIAIIPIRAPYTPPDVLLYAVCFIGGFAGTMLMGKLNRKS